MILCLSEPFHFRVHCHYKKFHCALNFYYRLSKLAYKYHFILQGDVFKTVLKNQTLMFCESEILIYMQNVQNNPKITTTKNIRTFSLHMIFYKVTSRSTVPNLNLNLLNNYQDDPNERTGCISIG